MTEPTREPCRACGRATFTETLAATGGYCRKCRPAQPEPKPRTAEHSGATPIYSGSQPAPGTVFVFMPSLLHMLQLREQEKGAPLTESEVTAIRDGSIGIIMSGEHAGALSERRGYPDINPEHCWHEW